MPPFWRCMENYHSTRLRQQMKCTFNFCKGNPLQEMLLVEALLELVNSTDSNQYWFPLVPPRIIFTHAIATLKITNVT